MKPPEASSPMFATLDPTVLDTEMNGIYQDGDMDFMNSGDFQQLPSDAGREFDDIFARSPESQTTDHNGLYVSPSEMSFRRQQQTANSLKRPLTFSFDSPSDSTGDNSSPGSSVESTRDHARNSSVGSAVHSDGAVKYENDGWPAFMNKDNLFGLESEFNGFDTKYSDIESSNRVMDSAFDFDSAASSPMPANKNTPQTAKKQKASTKQLMTSHPGSPFYPNSSREASPMTSRLHPNTRSISSSQWSGRSPSSIMDDPPAAVDGNSFSAHNALLHANTNMTIGPNDGQFEASDYISPFYAKSVARVPSRPILHVHPTSLKSRVETQIPIRLTLFPLPAGVKKLRLPTHTISKPKFLAKPDVGRSPDTLELHTSLVCTSAMQDKSKLEKAYARARGEVVKRRSSTVSTTDIQEDDEDKPLEGGEVKICQGCIQRERKRASRKKQRKPGEDELFQKDEDKRVIVFNTSEIKEWVEPAKESTVTYTPPGAMQVELPMRIACYCRHQNEKTGFQVILTIKDHLDNVIAQAMTNSIMITDDHKTHAAGSNSSAAANPSAPLTDGTQLPGTSVFISSSSHELAKAPVGGQQAIRISPSTDSQSLPQHMASQYPMTSGPFVSMPQNSGTSSASLTPRNSSRQTSPSEYGGPSSKRRKHSNSGKLPTGLTMTRLDSPQASSSSGSSANNQVPPNIHGFFSPTERPFATPIGVSGPFSNGPPTPNNNNEGSYFTSVQPNFDGLAQHHFMSTPSSTHASRPSSPGLTAARSLFEPAHNLSTGPNPVNQAWPHLTNAGNRLPTIIHKLVPAEGSTTGGTEVTLLGSGFYPGMEVVFGDTLATTTTFWGDKCLNCLTPPALQPGLVPVVFKHEHPTFGQVPQAQPILPKQQHFFRYVDDRELQMYRLALSILGQKLRNPSDAFQTAQRIMGGDQAALWNLQNDIQGGSSGQRQIPNLNVQGQTSDLDSRMLTYLEFIDLDDSPRAPRYNMKSSTGQTLLHFASSLGLTRFVAGLLARGANPDVQDNNGHTPMHFAALSGHAHIVHRLRLAGADAMARSIRGFTSADIATSLPAHQAAVIPARHYRSRSVGSSPSLRRRPSSSASLSSFWEASSASESFNLTQEQSDDEEATETDEEELNVYISSSRRSSVHQDVGPSLYYTRSREDSVPADSVNPEVTADDETSTGANTAPPASLVAWRNQLATQINQFQQSVGRAFPNLPALPPMPPMPALPDYQAYPMMRRISNLVPHRPGSSWSSKDGWWEMFTGNSSPTATNEPPAYDELYPHQEADEDRDLELKKTSLLRAATDAALDQHFEDHAGPSNSNGETEESEEELTDIRIGRKTVISRQQQEQLKKQQARKMKGLAKDKNLYFFWIPMLLLFLGLWLRNFVPGLWQGISEGYEFFKTRYIHRAIAATP
ncbi:membrane-tethered transcription factor (SPT23), putative [Talaromyces stipitatus ATCC 10500]|uniref:Membrane-tethered transcription factor (SPT23), putative n=1 Tax=Talaromyces stipitatus (strain ATCC 10500 / CBS 375.48 / QM 6759 / NRRL 1006) TaxID=441959 RepID=B8M2G4_TALSN|nr:membrane-tethered transcription factor (SPT23), putative [Talaromyces stipitatus ATCC 10500]EED21628.1 membrane-tethered transcription factor (SPT23), putative [Talaromyces stipitatus ATCC 10500]